MKSLLKKLLKAVGKALLKLAVDEVVKGREEGRWEHGPQPPGADRTIDLR